MSIGWAFAPAAHGEAIDYFFGALALPRWNDAAPRLPITQE
jgi:hypothetical protein